MRFGRTVSAFSILSQKRSEGALNDRFLARFFTTFATEYRPPSARWRVSSVGERGAITFKHARRGATGREAKVDEIT